MKPNRKPKKSKKALFASVPVAGPPCLSCKHDRTIQDGTHWLCPVCGESYPAAPKGV